MDPVPTPGQWLAELLASSRVSHAALARRIGRTRAEITRWTSGREQIPRVHLAEAADQIGPPWALDYALRLKDCEDAEDHLARSSLRLARRIGTKSPDIAEAVRGAVEPLRNPNLDGITAAQELMRLLTAANFAVSQWTAFVENNDIDLFTPDSIGRHLRYPVNHFVGTLLAEAHAQRAPSLIVTRTLGLANLRKLVGDSSLAAKVPLIPHHSIHMLARYGDESDRATVQGTVLQDLKSDDRLSRKLAYSGLIQSPSADADVSDRYLYELTRDPQLARIDLAFDATHYGDLTLSADSQLRPLDHAAPKLLQNILKHYSQTDAYGRLAEIDALRALSTLELTQPSELSAELSAALISAARSGDISASGGIFQRMLHRELSYLPNTAESSYSLAGSQTDRTNTSSPKVVFDLFIAYSSNDEDFVRKLTECLQAKGLRCWVDFQDMPLGKLQQESLEHGLASSKAALVVLGSELGKWQRIELQAAVSYFVENEKLVIPFVISGDEIPVWSPRFLRQFGGVILNQHASLDGACSKVATNIATHHLAS